MTANAPQTACSRVEQRHSLGSLRRQSGLSYRDLAERANIPLVRVHRILQGKHRPRRQEAVALRRAMEDVIRRQRSSEPDFLRQIQTIAVPFLEERLRVGARARTEGGGD